MHQFWSDWFISFVTKNNILRTMCLHFSKMSNIEHRAVIKFFTQKGLNATEISKELIMFTRTLLHRTALSPSGWLSSTIQTWLRRCIPNGLPINHHCRWKHWSRRTDRNAWSTNLCPLRDLRIGHSKNHRPWDHETSIRHEEGLCTRWVPRLFTPIQRADHVECYQELL